MEHVIKGLPPSARVMEMVKDRSPMEGQEPFQFVGQLKLFKAGAFGTSVTIWSSYEDGYGPTQLMLKDNEPVVIKLDDQEIDDQARFGAAYIAGFVEGVGGDIEKLSIWLEPHGS